MFTAAAKTFLSPCPTPRSLETGEKRSLGTYAAGNTAYQTHKTKLGQSGWVCTLTEWGCNIGTHTRVYQGEWLPVLPSSPLLFRKHPFLYKSSWQSRSAHVHWPRDHTRGISYKKVSDPTLPLQRCIHKTVHGVEDAKRLLNLYLHFSSKIRIV